MRERNCSGIVALTLRLTLCRAERRSAFGSGGLTPPWRGKLAATEAFGRGGVPTADVVAPPSPRPFGCRRDAGVTAGGAAPGNVGRFRRAATGDGLDKGGRIPPS